jgi:ketosteroid isomerase-like protein
MQSSDELRSLILKLYEKEESGELFNFARQVYSHREGVLLLGSEPNDRYEGYEAIIGFYKTEGASGLEIRIDDLKAFSEGAFGWVVDRVNARLPDGCDIPVRHTYVLNREADEWKIVHAHISVGIPDDQLGAILKR